jgi:hypothetical protein
MYQKENIDKIGESKELYFMSKVSGCTLVRTLETIIAIETRDVAWSCLQLAG